VTFSPFRLAADPRSLAGNRHLPTDNSFRDTDLRGFTRIQPGSTRRAPKNNQTAGGAGGPSATSLHLAATKITSRQAAKIAKRSGIQGRPALRSTRQTKASSPGIPNDYVTEDVISQPQSP
jgi:hypothetical protein